MDDELKQKMRAFMKSVADLAGVAQAPFDPRVEVLLEIVHSLVEEQLELDKQYDWAPRAQQDDKFIDNTDTPSAEDLRRMMGED